MNKRSKLAMIRNQFVQNVRLLEGITCCSVYKIAKIEFSKLVSLSSGKDYSEPNWT